MIFAIVIIFLQASETGTIDHIKTPHTLNSQSSCICQSSREWEDLSNTSISWLILTHNKITMERSIRLLHSIWRPHHLYVLHVDKSVSHLEYLLFVQQIIGQIKNHDNIFVISEVRGGYKYELIEVQLKLLHTIMSSWPTASEKDYYYLHGNLPNTPKPGNVSNNVDNRCGGREWKYAAFLSGDSYPIQDIDVIVRRISRYPDTNRIRGYVVPSKTEKRVIKTKRGKEILKKLESAYRKCGQNEKANKLNVLWGSQWHVLTRTFVEYSTTSEFAYSLFEAFKYCESAGDEAYFQNLLDASCQQFRRNNDSFMYVPWHKGGHGAALELKITDIELVFKSNAMFARKIWAITTEKAIEERKKKPRNHEEDFLFYCSKKT